MNTRIGYVLILSFLFLSYSAFSQQSRSSLPAYVADQVIVAFEPGTSANAIADSHRQAAASPLRSISAISAVLVNTGGRPVSAVIAAYTKNPNVRYAEPNYLRVMIMPSEGQDPAPPIGLGIDYFAEQYGLHNTGQDFYYDAATGAAGAITASAGADVDAPEAWELHTGNATTTVAVLDTGVDCGHPDLIGKCVVPSIKFSQSATVDDVFGHGTLVASIIGANSDNGVGIAGVSWGTMIASVKVCYEYNDFFYGLIGLCDAAASAEGMTHAADSGYQVVNMSYGGPTASLAEYAAATYAWDKGVVLVAAASNNYSQTPMYPAAFDEVIAVAATDWFDNLAGFSNFGSSWVSLAAPGAKLFVAHPYWACGIPDTDPDGCYGWADGTSFSSPMVAGAAALVSSYIGPGATNAQVRAALQNGADSAGAHGQNMLAWTEHGRLNVRGALDASDGVTPPPPLPPSSAPIGPHVADLDGSSSGKGSTWSAQVTVVVHDENQDAVSGETLAYEWSDGSSGECPIIAGECIVQLASIAKKNGSIVFTVINISNVSVGTSPYDGASNHDPENDSNGSSITVFK
jgi:thermitase